MYKLLSHQALGLALFQLVPWSIIGNSSTFWVAYLQNTVYFRNGGILC